jgi:hypothetical protein
LPQRIHGAIGISSDISEAIKKRNTGNNRIFTEGHEDHEGEAGDQGMEKRRCTADLDGLSSHLIG